MFIIRNPQNSIVLVIIKLLRPLFYACAGMYVSFCLCIGCCALRVQHVGFRLYVSRGMGLKMHFGLRLSGLRFYNVIYNGSRLRVRGNNNTHHSHVCMYICMYVCMYIII